MFDRYVAQQKPSWKRRALIAASLVLHGIAAVAILIYSFIHVEEIAPPAVSLTFFNAAPPPPPPPPPPKKKSSSTTVEKKPETIIPTKVVQPTDTPKIVQPKEPEKQDDKEDDDGVEGGEEGGVKGGEVGGVKGGVIGGVKGGVVGGTGTDPNAKGPPGKMVAAFTLIKEQLQHPDPRMPDAFYTKFRGQTLRGMYKVCLRQDGHVSDVTVMTSLPGADEDVMHQIKANWLYKPQPVPVCFVSAIQVTLK
jgi:periplasmic protein TonB